MLAMPETFMIKTMKLVTDPIGSSSIDEAVFELVLVAERVMGSRTPAELFRAVSMLLAERSADTGQPKKLSCSGLIGLTRIERTVVGWVAEGLTNKEIGAELFVSHRTIDSHVSHALGKLGLTSRVQLARLVMLNETSIAS